MTGAHVAVHGDRIAIVDAHGIWPYSVLADHAGRLATALAGNIRSSRSAKAGRATIRPIASAPKVPIPRPLSSI